MGIVVIDVMLKSEILDPQGQAVAFALPRLTAVTMATPVESSRINRAIPATGLARPAPLDLGHDR